MPPSTPPRWLIFIGDDVEVTLATRDPRAMRRVLTETLDALDSTPAEAADAMQQLAAITKISGGGT